MKFAQKAAVIASVVAALACGARTNGGTDGSTHFWQTCEEDAVCGSDRECICGRCTTECDNDSACSTANAVCVAASARLDCTVDDQICAPRRSETSESSNTSLDASTEDHNASELDASAPATRDDTLGSSGDTTLDASFAPTPLSSTSSTSSTLPCQGSASCSWTPLAPPPMRSVFAATAVHASKFYVLGGTSFTVSSDAGLDSNGEVQGSEDQRSAYVYDTVADQWSQLAPLPEDVRVAEGDVIGDKAYVVDVRVPDAPLYIYDIPTDNWTLGAPCPESLVNAGIRAASGKLYVFGGFAVPSGLVSFESSEQNLNTYVYDPISASWDSVAPLPLPVSSPASCTLDDRVYVFGGWFDPDPTASNELKSPDGGALEDATLIYDIETATWGKGAPVPTRRDRHSCAVIGEYLYLFGGATDDGTLADVFRYNPASDVWQEVTTVPDVDWIASSVAAIDGSVYVLGVDDPLGPNPLLRFTP